MTHYEPTRLQLWILKRLVYGDVLVREPGGHYAVVGDGTRRLLPIGVGISFMVGKRLLLDGLRDTLHLTAEGVAVAESHPPVDDYPIPTHPLHPVASTDTLRAGWESPARGSDGERR